MKYYNSASMIINFFVVVAQIVFLTECTYTVADDGTGQIWIDETPPPTKTQELPAHDDEALFPLTATPIAMITPTEEEGFRRITSRFSGVLDIPFGYGVDLDKGIVGGGTGVDIWFDMQERLVKPINGAMLGVASWDMMGYDGCQEFFGYPYMNAGDFLESVFFCVKTNEGNISEIKVTAFNRNPGWIKIYFVTWIE